MTTDPANDPLGEEAKPPDDVHVEGAESSPLEPAVAEAPPDQAPEALPKEQEAPFEKGDHVKVKDGTFAGMEGSVKDILEHKGAVVVELTIFGRPVPVELEYWQVDEA